MRGSVQEFAVDRKLHESDYSLIHPLIVLLFSVSVAAPQSAPEKNIDSSRDKGLKMLKVVKEEIKANYYDPKFHGMDLDARFKLAEVKIMQALSAAQIIGIIAQAVIDLNDSHTNQEAGALFPGNDPK